MQWRRLLTNVHLVVGVAAAPLLAAIGGSGALLAFEDPLSDALDARLTVVTPLGTPLPLDTIAARLLAAQSGARVVGVQLPEDARHSLLVSIASRGAPPPPRQLFVDPYTARVLGRGADASGWLQRVHQFHTRLLAGPYGATVVAVAAVALVVLALAGLVLWWPGRVLRVRRGSTSRRLVLDVHRALGGWTWAALLLLGVTGAVVRWEQGAQRVLTALGGATPPSPPDSSTVCDGRAELPLGTLGAAAVARMPGATLRAVQFVRGLARFSFRYPEDRTPNGRSVVLLEPCTARVAFALSTRGAPVAYVATRVWNRALHTGDVLGWPTRLLAAAASLCLPALALTGPMIWWRRRAARRGRAAESTIARRAARVAMLAMMIVLGAAAARAQAPRDAFVGDWRGESVCLVRGGACHDEIVVYRIAPHAAYADTLTLAAWKIVRGREDLMGTLACAADGAGRVLTCPMPPQYPAGTWRFVRADRTLEGTLTMADGTPMRRIRVTFVTHDRSAP